MFTAKISMKAAGAYVNICHKCLDKSLTALSCSSLSWPEVTHDPSDPCLQYYLFSLAKGEGEQQRYMKVWGKLLTSCEKDRIAHLCITRTSCILPLAQMKIYNERKILCVVIWKVASVWATRPRGLWSFWAGVWLLSAKILESANELKGRLPLLTEYIK